MDVHTIERAELTTRIQSLEELVDEANQRAMLECSRLNDQVQTSLDRLIDILKKAPETWNATLFINSRRFSALTPHITYNRISDGEGSINRIGGLLVEVFKEYKIIEARFMTVFSTIREQQEQAYSDLWETITEKIYQADDPTRAIVYVGYPGTGFLVRSSIDFQTGIQEHPEMSGIPKTLLPSDRTLAGLILEGRETNANVYIVNGLSSNLSGQAALRYTLKRLNSEYLEHATKREAELAYGRQTMALQPELAEMTTAEERALLLRTPGFEGKPAAGAGNLSYADLSRLPLLSTETMLQSCTSCISNENCPALFKSLIYHEQDHDNMS